MVNLRLPISSPAPALHLAPENKIPNNIVIMVMEMLMMIVMVLVVIEVNMIINDDDDCGVGQS